MRNDSAIQRACETGGSEPRLRILELAESGQSFSIDEVAARLGVHQSNAYRLLRTMEGHGLVSRGGGRVELGARLAALASGVARDLQATVLAELTPTANDLNVTCFLAVLDRADSSRPSAIAVVHMGSPH